MIYKRLLAWVVSFIGLFTSLVLLFGGSVLAAETVRVFILAGQSNMQGCGVTEANHPELYNGGKGNLEWSMEHSESKELMTHLKNSFGFWKVRDDVLISYKNDSHVRKDLLTVGYTGFGGASHIGPELQFGHVVGDHFDEPVLLIKTAWGGKSLFVDFRPPSAGGTVGPYYLQMIEEVREALRAINAPYELAGFIWMQGWNDMLNEEATAKYTENLGHLASDVRREFRSPTLPVVIGELGNGGVKGGAGMMAFRKAQRAGTRFIEDSIFVETHLFARDPQLSPNVTHAHHWYGNAESYFLIGDALAKGYLKLASTPPKDSYPYRIFRSVDGNEIEARFTSINSEVVSIQNRNGQVFEAVPLGRFSEEDQDYIRSKQGSEVESYQLKAGQISGYGGIRINKVDKAIYGGGYSMYSAVWPLVETYPGNRYQTGLLHTWMFAQYDPAIDTKGMYSCIEGGLGWWRDTRFATETPKFIMGGVALKFSEWANGPGAGKGRDWDQPNGKYAIAQLSSRVLWPPDGLNIKQGTSGELFGYGYRPLPLIESKTETYGEPVPTGDQCWTLFINTENAKGPITFFLPEFFARPTIDERKMAGQFLDSRPANPDRSLSMETQYIPAFVAEGENGEVYSRIAPVLYPKTGDETVLAHQVSAYPKAPFWDAMNQWFAHGERPSSEVFAKSSAFQTFEGSAGSSWSIFADGIPKEERRRIDWDVFMKSMAFDDATFGYRWNEDFVSAHPYKSETTYKLPEYFRLDSASRKQEIWVPILPAQVPSSTGLHQVEFPTAGKRIMEPYVTPTAPSSVWKSPGPVSGPHIAYLGDGSAVTYYWYRFADQPAIQKAALTPAEREELQRRVELIHQNWPLDQTFIPEPTTETPLAMIDPALIVEPPVGLEVGYVPIATHQKWANQPSKVELKHVE
jgi:hypothetical protein